jgi:hypothetical protein
MDSSDSVCRISASGEIRKNASVSSEFHLGVVIVSVQSQRLHIRANDITNPADLGVAVDFVDAGLFLAKAIL